MKRGRHLVLFDGVCALCNGMTRFILPRDRKDRFRFAPLQSDLAKSALARFGKDPKNLDTFYVVENYQGPATRLLDRDRAGIFVLERLGFPWALAWVFNLVPRFLRRVVYNFVARRRYRWFGRFDTIPLPPEQFQRKFWA